VVTQVSIKVIISKTNLYINNPSSFQGCGRELFHKTPNETAGYHDLLYLILGGIVAGAWGITNYEINIDGKDMLLRKKWFR
jgi:hypothetical protein